MSISLCHSVAVSHRGPRGHGLVAGLVLLRGGEAFRNQGLGGHTLEGDVGTPCSLPLSAFQPLRRGGPPPCAPTIRHNYKPTNLFLPSVDCLEYFVTVTDR